MPQPELNGEDVFHVIGFTNQAILDGAQIRLMQHLVAPPPSHSVVKKLVEVYF